jgi:thiamine-phosphate pyrophosphorylase
MYARRDNQEPMRPGLVLVTPRIEDAGGFAPSLTDACNAADISAVIVRLVATGEELFLDQVRRLAPIVHGVGAALLIEGHARLVEAAQADGVHLVGVEPVAAARGLYSDRIVGVGTLPSRHDAMTAGEAGADYVMFGEPDETGKRPTIPSLTERVTWWSELFVIPCVAYAGDLEEIPHLLRAGADFIALGEEVVWREADRSAAAVAAAVDGLDIFEPVE